MNKIYAFVTTYYPDKIVEKNIKKIAEQVYKTVVCDNSPHNNLFIDQENIIYITNQKNLGLSKAFNKALEYIGTEISKDDFVIFFDQDSAISAGYIQKLCNEYEKIENINPNIGCLGPVFFNTSNQKLESPKIKTKITDNSYVVKNIITSSMIMKYKNLKKTNFWNEKIFLDLADWDLCWRLEKEGLICAITNKVILHHSVGSGEKRIGFLHLRVGQPFREYYQTRDALYLLKENYVPLKMKIRLIANITVRPIIHCIFLDKRRERLKYIRQGFIDYSKNRHDEMRKYL